MDEEERDADILYGMHTSNRKEAEFIRTELAEKLQSGHVAVFPLEAFTFLKNLCLSPVSVIPRWEGYCD